MRQELGAKGKESSGRALADPGAGASADEDRFVLADIIG
jgi:hypothetical protein